MSLWSRDPLSTNHSSPAAPRHHGAVTQHADAEDGALVHPPHGLGDAVVPPGPQQEVAVGVPGEGVPRGGEGEAGEVLGLVPGLQHLYIRGVQEKTKV